MKCDLCHENSVEVETRTRPYNTYEGLCYDCWVYITYYAKGDY